MPSNQYHAKAAPAEVLSDVSGNFARVTCAACGAHEEWRIKTGFPPPEMLPRHFSERGWGLRRKPTCPICSTKKTKPKEKPMTVATAKPAATVSPIKPESIAVSAGAALSRLAETAAAKADDAKRNKRMVIIALEDCYVEGKRCYRSGHSDTSVAKELDLAPAFVAAVREEFYGKLAEPDDVRELREELAAARISVAAIETRFAALAARQGWTT